MKAYSLKNIAIELEEIRFPKRQVQTSQVSELEFEIAKPIMQAFLIAHNGLKPKFDLELIRQWVDVMWTRYIDEHQLMIDIFDARDRKETRAEIQKTHKNDFEQWALSDVEDAPYRIKAIVNTTSKHNSRHPDHELKPS